ncbi:MAG: efflux RND transporter permease subunit [Bradymonadaceae bacterium]|nr:efflux RND transporter permease subunit [Lujinxingiaceae bacterium]
MKLTRFAIEHSMSVYVLIVTLVIGGLISYFSLPREAAPDIAIPVVIVSTPYFGVSPVDIEMLVTRPLEKKFKSLRNLKRMNSTSAESVSLITLEFEPDVDIDEALQRIRVQVDKAKPDLPPDAEETEIIEINASDWPILIANVSGDLDLLRLKDLAEQMQDELESVTGVLRVGLAGGIEREIQIAVDPDKLRHRGASVNEVITAIQTENINLPGGSLDIGSMKYIVRVAGEFRDMETIRNIVVKAPDGNAVYLRDVADVIDSFKEPTTFSRLTTWTTYEDGRRELTTRPNVSLSIVKRAGSNIISIAQEAKQVIARYDQAAGDSVNITIVNDMSVQIQARVHELENNIISGLILVLGVLFFFMGGARNALFVAVSVPLSMLITFIVLSMMGITLNMVVLFSLVLALGMLVDNAIVIVENIYRHASEGKDRVQAALDGTTEVGWAVIASTATTVAAFAPMLFWPGVTGKFMGFLPKTVIITLLASLFVALIINPTLCAAFLKVREGVTFSEVAVPDNVLYRAYKATLVFCLNQRVLVVFLAGGALVMTFVVFAKTSRGVEFFPQTTPEQFNISVQMPDGSSLAATSEVLERMQAPLDSAPELVTAWITDGGVQGGGQAGGGGEAPHYGQITVELVENGKQTSDPYAFMDSLRDFFAPIPGATIILNRQSMGPPSGAPVSVEIAGPELRELGRIAREVREKIRPIEGIIDLKDDIELSRPEIHVVVDRQKAATAGLSTHSIAQTVRTAINGTKASNYREGDDEYDIVVRLPEDRRHEISDINSLTIVNKDNLHIPLIEIATVEILGGAGSVRRKDQERVVKVTANAADGYLPAKLLEEVQKNLLDLQLPAGYVIRYTGESEDQNEAASFLAKALLTALFLILLILVTEFNSITQPLIILCSVLLSLIGVLWVLILTGEAFGIIMTGIAVISLAGVVVNNAIVLIDYINRLRARGYERRDAVILAGMVRFRPVLLTAITTVLGLVPLVIGVSVDFVNRQIVYGGSSAEMWGQMARVVSGGLIVSTALTLIIVPVLYSLFDEISSVSRRMVVRLVGASAIVFLCMGLPMLAQAQIVPDEGAKAPLEQEQPLLPKPGDALSSPGKVHVELGATRVVTLEQARQLVREQSYDVQLAETQIEIAEGVIRQAWGALHPSVVASGSYTINQDEITFAPAPGAPEIVVQPRTDYRWTISASLRANFRSYPLIQQAYAQRDLARVQVDLVRENLDSAVISVYYNVLSVRRLIDLSVQQLESNRTMLRATEARRAADTATEFELTRARLRVVQAEKSVERARLQFVQVRAAAAELLQIPSDFDVVSPEPLKAPSDPEGLVAMAEQNRAVLAANAAQRDVARLALEEVYWRYLPAFTATASYSGSRGSLLSPGDPRWMIIFGAEWILWDGGMRGAEIDQRRAQLLAVDIRRRQSIHQITSGIEQAWAEFLAAQSQIESGQSEIELAAFALNQAQTAYRHGVATQLDVISAQEQLELAQIAQIQDQLMLELSVQRVRNLADPR